MEMFCTVFMSEDGSQSPTLRVRPGDELLVKLKNALPPSTTPSFQKHAMAGMSTLPEFSISGQSHEASPNGHDGHIHESSLSRNEYFADLPSG
jgi:hypothetical protein